LTRQHRRLGCEIRATILRRIRHQAVLRTENNGDPENPVLRGGQRPGHRDPEPVRPAAADGPVCAGSQDGVQDRKQQIRCN